MFSPLLSNDVEQRLGVASVAVLEEPQSVPAVVSSELKTIQPAVVEPFIAPRIHAPATTERSELMGSVALHSLGRHVGPSRGFQSLADADALASVSVSVCGVAGGVGATTIAAVLTRLLAKSGRRCGIFDETDDPTLPIFFGGQRSADDHRRFSGLQALFQPRVRILNKKMFGETPAGERHDLSFIERNFAQLGDQFEHLIFDQPVRCADDSGAAWKIYVAAPDLTSLGRMQKLVRGPEAITESRSVCVLNRFNPASALHNEILNWYQDSFRDLHVIHDSPLVTEALAEGTTVVDWAPETTVAADFGRLFGAVSRFCIAGTERLPLCS